MREGMSCECERGRGQSIIGDRTAPLEMLVMRSFPDAVVLNVPPPNGPGAKTCGAAPLAIAIGY